MRLAFALLVLLLTACATRGPGLERIDAHVRTMTAILVG